MSGTEGRNPTPPPPEPGAAPAWPHGAALGVLLGLGLAFGLLAREARRQQPDGPDRHALGWLTAHRAAWPGATRAFGWVTLLGDAPWSILATVGAAAALALVPGREGRAERLREAAFFVGVVASSWVSNRVLKLFFRRERPPLDLRLLDEGSFSFPSGHAAFAATLFGMLAVAAWRLAPIRSAALRGAIVAGCLLLAAAVAASRVWLGVHYVSDVIGGFALGLGWVTAAWTIREVRARRWLRGSAA